MLPRAWSEVASPVGRYGAAVNAARSRSLAARHRIGTGHLARRGRPDPAGQFARQIGDGGAQPVARGGR